MKNLNLKNETGRSMIEMLGVLAIIGVLSVGGIAGYSKAMMKYRINKTIEQISLIAANVQAFFGSQKNYDGIECSCNLGSSGTLNDCNGSGCSIIKKAKLVPDEMLTSKQGGVTINNEFGGVGDIGTLSGTDNKVFYQRYDHLPQEACIELATQDWSSITGAGFYYVAVTTDADLVIGLYDGPKVGLGTTDNSTYITAGPNSPITEISLEQATKICADGNNNYFAIGFKK
ncbi:MAG: hypothetical protein IJ525_04595 [Alphaproteobacteria bacterium]|nr:hypothetical protein [Alphaproteobacteria bacterium]